MIVGIANKPQSKRIESNNAREHNEKSYTKLQQQQQSVFCGKIYTIMLHLKIW